MNVERPEQPSETDLAELCRETRQERELATSVSAL